MNRRPRSLRLLALCVFLCLGGFLAGCSSGGTGEEVRLVDTGSETADGGDTSSEVGADTASPGCQTHADCTNYARPYCMPNGQCAECAGDAHCGHGECLTDRMPYECSCTGTGESCWKDGNCCSRNCGAGMCKEEVCRPTGEACTVSADCCGNLLCNTDGKCEACGGRGASCGSVGCCQGLSCQGRPPERVGNSTKTYPKKCQ